MLMKSAKQHNITSLVKVLQNKKCLQKVLFRKYYYYYQKTMSADEITYRVQTADS